MTTHFKFALVLTEGKDYLRKADLSYMTFLSEKTTTELNLSYDENGVVYILEEVNSPKIDKLQKLLDENGYKTDVRSTVKWKAFPNLN